MRRYLLLTIAAIGLAVLTTGCFNFSRDYEELYYYQVDYTSPPVTDAVPQKDVIVRVGTFAVAPAYQGQQIVYSTSALRRKRYDYHLWVVNPGDMLGDLFARDMVGAGTYKGVITTYSSLNPDYELEGVVDEIYEKDEGEEWYAVLSVRCVFFAYSNRAKHILFQRTFKETVRAKEHSPVSIAYAMSEAAQKISARLQYAINVAVSKQEELKRMEGEL
ncbi:MAG: membrane integrity-associated transporter subunit PqiC [Deltaproteobacteria bacterium]|nr:membrane integrity-associated transporter subunit PqiC [Deltaproteobacteria bacterium]MCB9490365.1 membrane integrity-associated transporter subunit PqiC [Deltaproteobacteria bacterium]